MMRGGVAKAAWEFCVVMLLGAIAAELLDHVATATYVALR